MKSSDADAATNAIASLARAGAVPASYFCASLQDPRPLVLLEDGYTTRVWAVLS